MDRYDRVGSFGRRAIKLFHEYYDAASRARDHQQRPFLRLRCRFPYFSSTDPPCDFAASERRALGADSAVGSRHLPLLNIVVRALRTNGKKEQTATSDATEFLTNVLASAPVKVTEIENDARAACAYSARIN